MGRMSDEEWEWELERREEERRWKKEEEGREREWEEREERKQDKRERDRRLWENIERDRLREKHRPLTAEEASYLAGDDAYMTGDWGPTASSKGEDIACLVIALVLCAAMGMVIFGVIGLFVLNLLIAVV